MPTSGSIGPRGPRPSLVQYMGEAQYRAMQEYYFSSISAEGTVLRGARKLKKPTKAKMTEEMTKLIAKRSEDELVQDGINQTVMGLRERFMKYFKGSCGDRMFNHVRVVMEDTNTSRGRFYYQRRETENSQEKGVYLNGDLIAIVRKNPDIITVFPGVIGRSSEMRGVHTLLKDFFKKYLGGVEWKEDSSHGVNMTGSNGEKDREIMKELGETGFGERPSPQMTYYYDEYVDMRNSSPWSTGVTSIFGIDD